MSTRGSVQKANDADYIFHITVVGDEVHIATMKSRDGMLYAADNLVLDPIRDGVLKFLAGGADGSR